MEPLRSWHQEKRKEAGWEWEAGPDVGGGGSWGPCRFIPCVLDLWAARAPQSPKDPIFWNFARLSFLSRLFSLIPLSFLCVITKH